MDLISNWMDPTSYGSVLLRSSRDPPGSSHQLCMWVHIGQTGLFWSFLKPFLAIFWWCLAGLRWDVIGSMLRALVLSQMCEKIEGKKHFELPPQLGHCANDERWSAF